MTKNIKHHTSKNLLKEIRMVLVEYLKTQCVIVVVVSICTWVILSFLGVRFALLLSVITGALSVIPIAGMATSAIIVSLVAMFDQVRFLPNGPELIEGIAIIVIYLIENGVIDMFITPIIARKFIHLHPVVIFSGVVIGSALFGFLGAFFAVPVLLIGRTVWIYVNRS